MNIWLEMLAESPPTLQRLIARANRISLPRGAAPEVRLERLRQALCHARTVRVTYFAMAPNEQAALQELRSVARGLSLDDLAARYGPVRPWSQIAADRAPQSLSERLILHGFLLPRPATRQHPTRFVVPPEVRRWLPCPLALPDAGPAPAPAQPLALRVATTILLTCAERPLPLRIDGQLRIESYRRLAPRLVPLDEAELTALCRFVVPLLIDLGLLAPHGADAALAPNGTRFLALPPQEQLTRLRAAWVGAPRVDEWLRPLLVTMRGIAWPVLRRRLLAWAAALPTNRLLDPTTLHDALTDALGPLADAHTHGYRSVIRTPWGAKRAAAVWDAALRGPLTWLGVIAWADDATAPRCFATPIARAEVADADDEQEQRTKNKEQNDDRPLTTDDRPLTIDGPMRPIADGLSSVLGSRFSVLGWRYDALGDILIPHAALDAAVLRLLPYAQWQAADAATTTYRLTPRRLAAARRDGYSIDALATLLSRQAGSLPADWRAWLAPAPAVRIVYGAVVTSDDPAVLDRAAQQRNVRRYLKRLAPGIALADPKRVESLTRALGRQDLTAEVRGAPEVARPSDLTAGECATLLAACACYRQHAPEGVAPDSLAALEDRLRAALPFEQRSAAALSTTDNRPPTANNQALLLDNPCTAAPPWPPTDDRPPTIDDHPATMDDARATATLPWRPTAGARLLAPLLAFGLALWVLVPTLWRGRTARRPAPVAPTPPAVPPTPDAAPPTVPPDPAAASTHLPILRQAIRQRQLITIGYQAAEADAPTTRIVRPLLLEGHGARWYLRAYCTLRRDERLFRVDRITALAIRRGSLRQRGRPIRQERPAPATDTRRPRPRPAPPRASFFAPPPDPPPGSPLVRVWLAD